MSKNNKEQRLCKSEKGCIYKSYFGKKCIAPTRVIWRTCRHSMKETKK